MVNKTFLPPGPPPGEIPKPLIFLSFPTWHGFRSVRVESFAAWESR
jgi:hypothetical protein